MTVTSTSIESRRGERPETVDSISLIDRVPTDIDLPEVLPTDADLPRIDMSLDDEELCGFSRGMLDIEQDCENSIGEMSSMSSSCVILGVDAQVACSEAISTSGSEGPSIGGRSWFGRSSCSVPGLTSDSARFFRRSFPR
jgi:hypothetical protein